MFNDIDAVYLACDFNGRVGESQDTIYSIDDVPQQVAVDNTVNQYGHHLLDFLKDTKLCMLNGRISPCLDNFTCVSSRGR